ncbi:MAG TPA: metallophosphoesterase [Thermomicrobiaceae bacterium]|nr:metallophosphoesterase [Thermomicrobiaceae bacterium]
MPDDAQLPVITDPDIADVDPLVCVVSDLHLGGDPGQSDFFAAAELATLLDRLTATAGPIELVLAGDVFEMLQIHETIGSDGSRVRPLMTARETACIFERLRRFAAGPAHRVICLVGNHDNQLWWDEGERRVLLEGGYVHEIALSYEHVFGSDDRGALLYCEHGAEYDPANAVHDYTNPLSTPLGHHLVVDVVNHLEPLGLMTSPEGPTSLADIDNIHPLEMVPWWFVSRFFYRATQQAVKYVVGPGLLLYVLFHLLPVALLFERIATGHPRLDRLGDFFSGPPWLLLLFVIFDSSLALGIVILLLVRRAFRRARRRYGLEDIGTIFGRTERFWEDVTNEVLLGRRPPALRDGPWQGCDVFIYGHTHFGFIRPVSDGDRLRAVVNTGTWTRKVLPVRGRLKLPPVFLPTYELSYALAYVREGALMVELWEVPKRLDYSLPWPERLAIVRKERPPYEPASLEPHLLDRVAVPLRPLAGDAGTPLTNLQSTGSKGQPVVAGG